MNLLTIFSTSDCEGNRTAGKLSVRKTGLLRGCWKRDAPMDAFAATTNSSCFRLISSSKSTVERELEAMPEDELVEAVDARFMISFKTAAEVCCCWCWRFAAAAAANTDEDKSNAEPSFFLRTGLITWSKVKWDRNRFDDEGVGVENAESNCKGESPGGEMEREADEGHGPKVVECPGGLNWNIIPESDEEDEVLSCR